MKRNALRFLPCLIVATCAASLWAEATTNSVRLRRPVALALVESDKVLLVANRDSGTISVVDLASDKVKREYPVADRLSDLQVDSAGSLVLATDEAKHQLLVFKWSGQKLALLSRTSVSHSPVFVTVDSAANRCFVASLWSRRMSVVDLANPSAPKVEARIDLSFAPRKLLLLPKRRKLIIADSFGGKLAALDLESCKIEAERSFPGHNIRGLALSPDGEHILLAHQILHREESTTFDGVHWGGVMSNVISTFAIDDLLAQPKGQLSTVGAIRYLGHPNKAAPDPDALLTTSDNRQLVAYAGSAEVAVSDPGANYFKPIAVGRRPTALTLNSKQDRLYVANTLSDTVSVVDVTQQKVVKQIALGPAPKLTLAQQGEVLFHDARLASDGWYSCHSCHTDGHSNGGLNDNFGDDSYGAPKRVLSLLGVAETNPWTWTGKVENLSGQIRSSIEVTMQGPKPSDHQVRALEAYLKTLRPPPSLNLARGLVDDPSIERGRRLFTSLGCADCHQPSTYTSADVYDVNLRDELGHTTFNPPSLRGVGHRPRLFHDNRAKNLRAVFDQHGHQLDHKPTRDELDALLSFLKSL